MRKAVRPRRVTQNRSYVEPRYDSDYDSLPERSTKPSRHSARLRAACDDLSTSDTHSLSENELPPLVRRTTQKRPVKRKTRSATAKAGDGTLQNFKKTKVTHSIQKVSSITKAAVKRSAPDIGSRGTSPQWQTLPYQVLLKVMKYAAYPLYVDQSRDTGSIGWLLNTSTLCRAFHEACLSALLFSPPLYPAYRARGLIKLLKLSQMEFGGDIGQPLRRASSRISTDYRTKIQRLSFEANALLASKSGIDLSEILEHTPLLKSLIFYHNHDFFVDKVVWAHPTHSRVKNRWQYTQFYSVIQSFSQRLNIEDFEWNARFFIRDDELLLGMYDFYRSRNHLAGVKSMTIRNFIQDDVESLNETVSGTCLIGGPDSKANSHQARLMTWRMSLKEAFGKSKELKQLSIHSSNVFDAAIVAALPAGLHKLEVVNCPLVNSDGVQAYLSERGYDLTELVLKGNQYMSLDFMTKLKQHCPKLALLIIDLTYRDPTSFKDTEPLFDSLLPSGPPTWPETLQHISVGPLRQLSTKDAENFYQSLVDSSPHLSYLRVLELRTLLNQANWRDRAALRTKWSLIFDEVFHVNKNPDVKAPGAIGNTYGPNRRSLTKHVRESLQKADKPTLRVSKYTHTAKRTSRRLQDLAISDSSSQLSDSQPELVSSTHSLLLKIFDGKGGEKAAINEDRGPLAPFVRRGRCHTVIFELSDQRPAQEQFREDDFLDDELEEDGDWRAG